MPSFPLKDYVGEAIVIELWWPPGAWERYKWEGRSHKLPVPLNPTIDLHLWRAPFLESVITLGKSMTLLLHLLPHMFLCTGKLLFKQSNVASAFSHQVLLKINTYFFSSSMTHIFPCKNSMNLNANSNLFLTKLKNCQKARQWIKHIIHTIKWRGDLSSGIHRRTTSTRALLSRICKRSRDLLRPFCWEPSWAWRGTTSTGLGRPA